MSGRLLKLIAFGAIALAMILTLRTALAGPPVRVMKAQIVESMSDRDRRGVTAPDGWQLVMVEMSDRVQPDSVTLNDTAPVAITGNCFVFLVREMSLDDMTFVYRPSAGWSLW